MIIHHHQWRQDVFTLYIKDVGHDIHKRNIADVCKISEVTINKCYKKLEIHRDKLIV